MCVRDLCVNSHTFRIVDTPFIYILNQDFFCQSVRTIPWYTPLPEKLSAEDRSFHSGKETVTCACLIVTDSYDAKSLGGSVFQWLLHQ